MDERQLILSLVKDYYRRAIDVAPPRTEQREFGFGNFESKIAFRHKAFRDTKELHDFLVAEPPLYVSYSTAYYRKPDGRPMEKKEWLGSELIFDLDATDMSLPCQFTHGKGWICADCLSAVKNEAIKLIEDFLIPDFGFSAKDMAINFSGNRGYHVHVNNEAVLALNSGERKEISDYISANGIDAQEFFPTGGQRGKTLVGPKPTDKGWPGKIAKNFLDNLGKGQEALMRLGVDKATATRLYNKRALVEMGIRNGNWDMVYIKNKADFWKNIMSNQTIAQSDRIDRNVTNDPSHLIRLPNTIHGSTGLVAKKIKGIKELEKFDPMSEAIAFKGQEVKIKSTTQNALSMNGESFGPFKEAEAKVPVYAAVYLYLKGFCNIIDVPRSG